MEIHIKDFVIAFGLGVVQGFILTDSWRDKKLLRGRRPGHK